MDNRNKEHILCAAILWNGILIPGYRHSDCYELAETLLPGTKLPDNIPHGFLTSYKRYVDRREGYKIAKDNDQLYLKPKLIEDPKGEELTSEELYYDPTDFFGLTKKVYDAGIEEDKGPKQMSTDNKIVW